MKIVKIIGIICLGVALNSCVKEPLTQGNIPEGKPVLVRMNLKMATMGTKQTKAQTLAAESEVNDIRVMVFNEKGKIVTNKKMSFSPNLRFDTYSGNNQTVYVVANAPTKVDNILWSVTTLDKAKAVTSTYDELGFGLGTDESNPLMMTGVTKANISPGSFTLPEIKLLFTTAKLTLNVIDAVPADQKVTILGWDIVDSPVNSYMYPDGGDFDLDQADQWFTTNNRTKFKATGDPKKATTTIYMLENKRGGRVNRDISEMPLEKRYPNMKFDDDDDKGKTFYAPKRSTHIVIYAMHESPDVGLQQIVAKIYIGADKHSNYDIVRSAHYTFNVKVSGLNDINIDSNVDYTAGEFKLAYEDLQMDAHPDFRPILITAPTGRMFMEIIDNNGNTYNKGTFAATWLKISPLDLRRFQVKQAGNQWQESGNQVGDKAFVRSKYIPHKSVRATLGGKLGWPTIPPGTDNDDELSMANATFRMCYKITDIDFVATKIGDDPTTQMQMFIYADQNNSTEDRTAWVRFTFYKGAAGTYADRTPDNVIEYQITQKGYLSMYNESATDEDGLAVLDPDTGESTSQPKTKFVLEQFEEVDMRLYAIDVWPPQKTLKMQWGFEKKTLYEKRDKFRNGRLLTANAVYEGVTSNNGKPTWNNSNIYRDLYKSGAHKNHIDALPRAYNGPTTGAPYFYALPIDNTDASICSAAHPIFNTTAARYCHEKNRDINGDGSIDESEAIWYLPSIDQLAILQVYNDFIVDKEYDVPHWSSTEAEPGKPEKAWLWFSAINYLPAAANDLYRVRCVRDL